MNLFEPITIRGLEFKNRIVMPPMQVAVGLRSRRARAYYAERAQGGAGTIIMAATSVDLFTSDDAWGKPNGVDSFLEGVGPLIQEVKQAGARIGVQLWHGNQFPAGTGAPQDTSGEAVAPSATKENRELTISEIETIISRFAGAAANAKRAGFDFVEVHGAHGYLACQFFSPATNHRNDKYGGDLSGRMRFGLECVVAMRAASGTDYPIFYRLGAWEDIAHGLTIEESASFASELEKAGTDVIDVSLGSMSGTGLIAGPGSEQPEGTFVSLAEAIKNSVTTPVIAVGRFRTPEVAEAVVAEGRADMVAVGRQLIADPHWPHKVEAGRAADILPCISCNACFETVVSGTSLRCSVNASAGKELENVIVPAEIAKRVLVIGGGPAGMEAARVAAQRGHRVTLYERERELGGQLHAAAAPPYKQEVAALRDYLARQLAKSGVEVRLAEEVTATSVEDSKPDAVIVAAGATSLVPEIPGVKRDNVVTASDVLLGKSEVGEKVVIIGGELVGCETADFLCQKGKQVTVVRRGPDMATKMSPINREALLSRLNKRGVTLLTGVTYEEITDLGLVITDKEGSRRTLEADSIVLAAGAVSNTALFKAVEGKVPEIHNAGDCLQPRRILDAIHDGARLGREV